MDQPLTRGGSAAEAVVSAGTRGRAKDGGLTPGESGGGEIAPLFRPPAHRLRAKGARRPPPQSRGTRRDGGPFFSGVLQDLFVLQVFQVLFRPKDMRDLKDPKDVKDGAPPKGGG